MRLIFIRHGDPDYEKDGKKQNFQQNVWRHGIFLIFIAHRLEEQKQRHLVFQKNQEEKRQSATGWKNFLSKFLGKILAE